MIATPTSTTPPSDDARVPPPIDWDSVERNPFGQPYFPLNLTFPLDPEDPFEDARYRFVTARLQIVAHLIVLADEAFENGDRKLACRALCAAIKHTTIPRATTARASTSTSAPASAPAPHAPISAPVPAAPPAPSDPTPIADPPPSPPPGSPPRHLLAAASASVAPSIHRSVTSASLLVASLLPLLLLLLLALSPWPAAMIAPSPTASAHHLAFVPAPAESVASAAHRNPRHAPSRHATAAMATAPPSPAHVAAGHPHLTAPRGTPARHDPSLPDAALRARPPPRPRDQPGAAAHSS